MNKLNHTPAPWQYLSNDKEREFKYFVYNAAYSKWAIAENMKKSDARLISCAPEMLDYLIEQSKESIEMWKDNCSGFYFNEWKTANIKKVNLIEKATGLKIEEIIK